MARSGCSTQENICFSSYCWKWGSEKNVPNLQGSASYFPPHQIQSYQPLEELSLRFVRKLPRKSMLISWHSMFWRTLSRLLSLILQWKHQVFSNMTLIKLYGNHHFLPIKSSSVWFSDSLSGVFLHLKMVWIQGSETTPVWMKSSELGGTVRVSLHPAPIVFPECSIIATLLPLPTEWCDVHADAQHARHQAVDVRCHGQGGGAGDAPVPAGPAEQPNRPRNRLTSSSFDWRRWCRTIIVWCGGWPPQTPQTAVGVQLQLASNCSWKPASEVPMLSPKAGISFLKAIFF